MATGLFRQEVVARRQSTLFGEVTLSTPPSSRLLTLLAVAAITAIVAFAALGHYTRKAHVSGYLAPDKGIIKVYPAATGTLVDKRVSEGQTVQEGEILFLLSTDHGTTETPAAQAAAIARMRERLASLRAALPTQAAIDASESRTLSQQIRGLEAESAQLQVAIDTQAQRLASAEETATQYRELAAKHFVSDLQSREKLEQVLDQRSRLEVLRRDRTTVERDLAALRGELSASALRARNQRAASERDIAAMEQELTEYESRRSVVVAAPAHGTVTAILVERGQTVSPGTPLLTVLPTGAVLQAQLLVPSRAIGFIKQDQTVSLRYEAFPFQRFGSHQGRVTEIAKTLISPNDATLPVALNEPVYRVTVALATQTVNAYAQDIPLQSGMLLAADVWLDRRRILEWIFDPLYSVAGRL
jgi:membrane fusion protein